MRGWTREQAIVDVLDASDGATGRVFGWPLRPVALKRCAGRGCYKRFPVGNARRRYHSAKCRGTNAERRARYRANLRREFER